MEVTTAMVEETGTTTTIDTLQLDLEIATKVTDMTPTVEGSIITETKEKEATDGSPVQIDDQDDAHRTTTDGFHTTLAPTGGRYPQVRMDRYTTTMEEEEEGYPQDDLLITPVAMKGRHSSKWG